MLPPVLFYSIGVFALKKVTENIVSNIVNSEVQDGVEEANKEIFRKMKITFLNSIIVIFSNIIAFFLAYFLSPRFFSNETAILIICTVYISSIIHSIWNFIGNFTDIRDFIFFYKLNLREFIEDKLRGEVRKKVNSTFNEMNFFTQAMNSLFGKSEREITYEITSQTMRYAYGGIIANIALIAVMIMLYVIVFRLWVLPILMADTIGFELNAFQVLLYPFFYVIDYIFGSSFKDWIV
ncbi:hypothetical protein [uncultured Actinobacillus sp.]|uniref:hypothetical protein n=1 Tax=uncultured Actinobacillus sp. TaxID=417616 RepID=UPI0025EA0224|nr:hypothetical protein [uncultured Actinobacillus sp.]